MLLASKTTDLLAIGTLVFVITVIAEIVTRGMPISHKFRRASTLSVQFLAGMLTIYTDTWLFAILGVGAIVYSCCSPGCLGKPNKPQSL